MKDENCIFCKLANGDIPTSLSGSAARSAFASSIVGMMAW